MKSNKQRRTEIKARRARRAAAAQALDPLQLLTTWPAGTIAADPSKLTHNNTYSTWPLFYADMPFSCRDCGSDEVWTAKQQKWWYEEAQGQIHTRAVRCRPCRMVERARVIEARRVAQEGLARRRDEER